MVGLKYEAHWLSDYREQDFEAHDRKLVQQPIYDENRRLVRPWDQYRTLRPGTIVLVTAKVKVYRKGGNLVRCSSAQQPAILIPLDLEFFHEVFAGFGSGHCAGGAMGSGLSIHNVATLVFTVTV